MGLEVADDHNGSGFGSDLVGLAGSFPRRSFSASLCPSASRLLQLSLSITQPSLPFCFPLFDRLWVEDHPSGSDLESYPSFYGSTLLSTHSLSRVLSVSLSPPLYILVSFPHSLRFSLFVSLLRELANNAMDRVWVRVRMR